MYILITEMSTDIALGVSSVVAGLIMAVATLFIFHLIKFLGNAGFFYTLAGECTIGFLFVYFFVGESFGLTEREKRE